MAIGAPRCGKLDYDSSGGRSAKETPIHDRFDLKVVSRGNWGGYLLVEGEVVGEEADGVVDEQLVEVSLAEEVGHVRFEVLHEVEGVNGRVEARAEGAVVVLQARDEAEGRRLPGVGVDGVPVDPVSAVGVLAILRGIAVAGSGQLASQGVTKILEASAVLSVELESHLLELVASEG